MKIFNIPVTWECCGLVEIEAESLEEALKYAQDNKDELELPNPEYVDGSFTLTHTDIEELKLYNK